MESQKNLNNLSRKNELLKQLRNKKIDLPEFMKQCALWAAEILDDFVPQHDPSAPPKMAQYKLLSKEAKEKVKEEFWRSSEIFGYSEELHRRRNKNKSDVWWLKEWLKYIPEKDEEIRFKIIEKLIEYKGVMQGFDDTPELKEAQDIFGAQETILEEDKAL